MAAPQNATPQVIEHAHTCSDCAAFTRQLEAFEEELHSTLHVPVPDGLAEEIILRRSRPRWFGTGWLSLAAAIVVTLATLVTINTLPDEERFARKFVQHVASEPQIFAADHKVEQSALQQVFAELGAPLGKPIGRIKYLGQCRIDGVDSRHALISTGAGDAAVLFRPGRSADIGLPKIHREHAVVVVAAPLGSIAIVAATPQLASRVRAQILANVEIKG